MLVELIAHFFGHFTISDRFGFTTDVELASVKTNEQVVAHLGSPHAHVLQRGIRKQYAVKVASIQVGIGQPGIGEIRSPQVRIGKVDPGKVRTKHPCAFQVRADHA